MITNKPKRRSSEVVVITGASAGVGRATAREFAKQGAAIALLARGEDGLEACRREVEQLGGTALAIPLDVSDPDALEGAAQQTEELLGPIDIWVNNAMVSVFSPFKEMTPEEFKRVTEVTYLGYVYGTMSALRRMLPRDRGVIVQVGSALAYRAIPLQSAYCGAKHGIRGFTDSIRSELLHDKSRVHITMVQLPAINTPQFSWVKSRLARAPQPVPPIYQPEVPARAIVWAARHREREVYLGRSTTKVIVGNKFFPGLGDRFLAHMGYDAQQTSRAVKSGRKNNLWKPVPGDAGAHGSFDKDARSHALPLWLTTHFAPLVALGALALATGMASRRRF